MTSQLPIGMVLAPAGSPTVDTFVQNWFAQPFLLLALGTFALFYTAGVGRAWLVAGPGKGVTYTSACAGALGMVALMVALASPLEGLSALFFTAHMVQHLLLVLIAAPLLVAGVPLLAFLWLLPVPRRRSLVRHWRSSRSLVSTWHLLSSPFFAAAAFTALLWLWHLPAAYQAALGSEFLHALEHASLLAVAALFWWSLLQPMGQRRLSAFAAPLLLFVLAMQGGVLGAMITLSPGPWYSHYERVAAALGTSAHSDQQLAGLIMWVPPGAIYLLVACWLLFRALGEQRSRSGAGRSRNGVTAPDSGNRNTGAEPAHRSARSWLVVAGAALLGVGEGQVLNPSGPAAARISEHFWLMVILATLVCLLVYLLLFIALFAGRRRKERTAKGPPLGAGPFVVLGGIVLPLVILVPLLFNSLGLTAGLVRPAPEAITIEVIGHQWWWEVRYTDTGVVDANEIHIPVDRPVRLELSSADVIHSFWVPGLQGKMDLVPGNVNTLWIEATETGIFPGQCAEFCGMQHANMRLLVVAEPQENFGEWLAVHQGEPAPPRDPLVREGREVFLSSACVYCHTVEGTNASGKIGPDLTHIANRMTLGAGTVANNRGNLGGWIVNSQAIKPGNRMPPMYLDSESLQALLAYLETLE